MIVEVQHVSIISTDTTDRDIELDKTHTQHIALHIFIRVHGTRSVETLRFGSGSAVMQWTLR
jgi:hypothetical protein